MSDSEPARLTWTRVHGIFRARILEWVAISFSSGCSQAREPVSSTLAGRFFTTSAPREAQITTMKSESEVTQWCLTLCDPVYCSLPGSSVHGILQARILEWITVSFSRGSSRPRDWIQISRISGRRFNPWATREAQNKSIVFSKKKGNKLLLNRKEKKKKKKTALIV